MPVKRNNKSYLDDLSPRAIVMLTVTVFLMVAGYFAIFFYTDRFEIERVKQEKYQNCINEFEII